MHYCRLKQCICITGLIFPARLLGLRSCLHGLKLVILDESIKGLPDYKLKQLPTIHYRKLVMCIQPQVAQTNVTREGV